MYLLFEVGGTKTRIGFSNDRATLSDSKILSTPKIPAGFLNLLKKEVGSQKINAIAGGVPGVLNPERSDLISAPHLPEWIGKNLKQSLEKEFHTRVLLENDAALGGLGEATFGAGKDYKIVAYFTIGTGVGGARIVKGKIDVRTLGFEPGHQLINPAGLEFEQYISGTALEKEYGKPSDQIEDQNVWDEAARRVALGLTNSILHWSPEIIVLGGGLMEKISVEAIKENIKQNIKVFPILPEITRAKLGELAGLYGALALLGD